MKNCKKCGNPETMYWCNECEANTEEKNCPACGDKLSVDKQYHDNCTGKHTDNYGDFSDLDDGDLLVMHGNILNHLEKLLKTKVEKQNLYDLMECERELSLRENQ